MDTPPYHLLDTSSPDVHLWNEWVDDNPGVELVFTRQCLAGKMLNGIKLPGARMTGIDMEGTNLSHADLTGVDMSGCNARRARFEHALMIGSRLAATDMTSARLDWARLAEVFAPRCNLTKARLSHAGLDRSWFHAATFTASMMDHVAAVDADFHDAIFSGACLVDADFRGVKAMETNFRFVHANGIDLSGANLYRADLDHGMFEGSKTHGAVLDQTRAFNTKGIACPHSI